MNYPFQKLFLICTGERCNDEKHGKDRGEEIRAELKELNKKLGRKGTVRVCAVPCLDLCEAGPNMVVQPGGIVLNVAGPRESRSPGLYGRSYAFLAALFRACQAGFGRSGALVLARRCNSL